MNKTNGTYVTIKEASNLTGKSCSTVFRLGLSKVIPWKKDMENGIETIMFDRIALFDFFGINGKNMQENQNPNITKTEIREVMEDFFETKQNQLMKPLESQAIYQVGKLETENRFLKERLEMLVEENIRMREQIKALPGPLEEIKEQIDNIKDENRKLKEELKILPGTPEEINQILLQNSDNMKILQERKETIKTRLINRENLIENQEEKIKILEEKLKEEEEEKLKIAEAWKERLAEAERPWWKKLLGLRSS